MRRNYSVFYDLLLVIDVVQEKIQRRDPLNQAAFKILPFLRRNDARHQVEGKNTLRAARVAIDVERNALAKKGEIDRVAFRMKILAAQTAKGRLQFLVMAENVAIAPKHFVEESIDGVTIQQRAGRLSFCQRGHFTSGCW